MKTLLIAAILGLLFCLIMLTFVYKVLPEEQKHKYLAVFESLDVWIGILVIISGLILLGLCGGRNPSSFC
jgi:hypothetical protein